MYAKQEGDLRAYALMRRGNELEAEYVRSEFGHLNRANLDELRKALAFERYSDYRGIARAPFAEDYMVGPQGWEDDEPEDDPEPEARRVMNEFLGPNNYDVFYPRTVVATLHQIRTIQNVLKKPQRYEIMELCTAPDYPARFIGFDIGYWGGGNYSILCDAAIWPRWHGPVREAHDALAKFTNGLNEAALFPNEHAVRRYLNWYGNQRWGEKPVEEFTIIAVGEVDSDPSE
jgi:hypothetical protein